MQIASSSPIGPPSDRKESSSMGGTEDDAEVVFEFLCRRKFTDFWAVICSHQHRDHARGLIKLVQNTRLTYQNSWMHDIRQHVSRDILRQAMAGNSSESDA